MISVIIPMYNVDKYIKDCLSSLEKQTINNFEVIVVDDGSTDNSLKVVESYIECSKITIRLITQSNSGVSAARNTGLKNAKGEYICFLDSDDILNPKFLAIMYNTLNVNDADLAICKMRSVPEHFDFYNKEINEADFSIHTRDKQMALTDYLYGKLISSACSIMVKKKVIIDNDILFSTGYKYSEDLEFVWKVINSSKIINSVDKELYYYRTREDSVMSKVSIERLDGIELMKGLEKYFKNQNAEFYPYFKKYGVARWVWATLWQCGLSCNKYEEFKYYMKLLDSRKNLIQLVSFPDTKVQLSSGLFLISPKLYYFFIRKFLKSRVQRKIINEFRRN